MSHSLKTPPTTIKDCWQLILIGPTSSTAWFIRFDSYQFIWQRHHFYIIRGSSSRLENDDNKCLQHFGTYVWPYACITDSFQKMQWKNFSDNNSSRFYLADMQLKRLECIFLWAISLVTGHVEGIFLVHCVLHNSWGSRRMSSEARLHFFFFCFFGRSFHICLNQSIYQMCSSYLEFITYWQGPSESVTWSHLHFRQWSILGLAAHESSWLDLTTESIIWSSILHRAYWFRLNPPAGYLHSES